MARPRKFPIRKEFETFQPMMDEYQYLVSNATIIFCRVRGVRNLVKIAKPEAVHLRSETEQDQPPVVEVAQNQLLVGSI